MTEVTYSSEEFDNFQHLKRRGSIPGYWSGRRFRRTARVVLNGLDTPEVTLALKMYRNAVNANAIVAEETPQPTQEDHPMTTILPSKEVLQSLGAPICELAFSGHTPLSSTGLAGEGVFLTDPADTMGSNC